MNGFDIFIEIVLVVSFIATIGLLIWFIYEVVYKEIRNKFLRYDEFNKVVKVGRKSYEKAHTEYISQIISTGKTTTVTMVPIFYGEAFNVYVIYKGKEYGFNDEEMFHSLEVGDTVNVVVHEGYNWNGKLKHIELTK